MKTVILCGGGGAGVSEHGAPVPKALIEIGGRPVLRHLLQIYSHHWFNSFTLCLSCFGDSINRYFLYYHWLYFHFSIAMSLTGNYQLYKHEVSCEDLRITFANSGLDTNTGGRVKQIEKYIGDDQTFCVTYGDGLADIDLPALIGFHESHGQTATLTAVH